VSTIHAKIAVVGSLNIDYIASVERLPAAGETVSATAFIRRFGGKGANQAVAAARQGAVVNMIACVGDDADGRAYRQHLQAAGIITTGLAVTRKALTGTAMIVVERSAENTIVVAAGANGQLTPGMVRAQRKKIISARILLVQFEVPMPAVIEAALHARRAGVPVVLNPSPLRERFPWGKCALDTVIANAGEAQAIFGLSLRQIARWQHQLAKWHIERLIITRGAQPTICISANCRHQIPTFPVQPVDSVGAGDAFAGTYVARRAEGLDALTAIRYANCAGALATLKSGAQESIPSRAATEKTFKRAGKDAFHRVPN
jgi:ribokinase